MTCIIPKSLQPGDQIAVISTARKISPQETEPAIRLLQEWGLKPVPGEHLFASAHQFAGTDEQRAADLQNAIDNPEIKAILCARGGYGTVRLLEKVDFSSLQKQPKWIIGYSDVTVLLNYWQQVAQIAGIHATMPVNFDNNTPESLSSLQQALFGASYEVPLPEHPMNRYTGKKITNAEITGGNLSILYSLTGTAMQVNTYGKILFIEDLDEYLYHIDRIMMNLKLAGMLHGLAGLLVGGMTDMHDNTVPFGQTAEEIILSYVQEYEYPVFFNVPAGHINDNRALIMGKKITIENNRIIFG